MTLDPDVVPAAVAARLFKRKRIVVDVHEDYLKLLNDRAWAKSWKKAVAKTLVRVTTWQTRRANLTVVADDHVPPLAARKRLVVRNLPDFSFLPEPGEPTPGVPRAIYIGDVRRSRGLQRCSRPWRARSPGSWTSSARSTPPTRPGSRPRRRAQTNRSGTGSGSTDVLTRRRPGRSPKGRGPDRAPGGHPGVPRGGAQQALQYLACGLAVVATPLPRMAELIAESGAGQVVADPASASATLRRWSDQYDELLAARQAARDWAKLHLTGVSPYDELAGEIRTLAQRSSHRPEP